jgi:hypothetical protein
MQVVPAQAIAATAVNLRNSLPQVPALDLLDQVLGPWSDGVPDFPVELVAPPSEFGQLIAEAFDPAMTPDEWVAWAGEGSDAAVREALMQVWAAEVLPAFRARYRIAH